MALESLDRTRQVNVKLFGGVMLCDSDGVDIQIEFTHVPGALPPLQAHVNTLAGSLGFATLAVVSGGQVGNNGAITQVSTRGSGRSAPTAAPY